MMVCQVRAGPNQTKTNQERLNFGYSVKNNIEVCLLSTLG